MGDENELTPEEKEEMAAFEAFLKMLLGGSVQDSFEADLETARTQGTLPPQCEGCDKGEEECELKKAQAEYLAAQAKGSNAL
jgi:hypothetical protein